MSEPIPRAVLPHPGLSLPTPGLVLDFRMSVALDPIIRLGLVPSGGLRNWISFSGGSWAATWGRGSVVGGQDTQIVDPATHVVKVETIYLLKTADAEPAQ